jgi:LysM repeat protein
MYTDPTGHMDGWAIMAGIISTARTGTGIYLGAPAAGIAYVIVSPFIPAKTCVTTEQEEAELAKYDAARKNKTNSTPTSYYPPSSSTSSAPTVKTPTAGSTTHNKSTTTWTANVSAKPAVDGKYKVLPGDTLEVIAKANKTTVAELMRINNISDPKKLQSGQTLKMPSNGGSPSPNNKNNKPDIIKPITKLVGTGLTKLIVEKVSGGSKQLNSEGGSKTGYELKPGVDEDLRGTGKTYQDALDDAFKKTGVPKEDFKVTKWAKDANGKSYPVEWRASNGSEVNIDTGHTTNGPDVPHVGYQTGGKRGSGGAVRGHILVDDVPVNR